jgi:hypothetical protein
MGDSRKIILLMAGFAIFISFGFGHEAFAGENFVICDGTIDGKIINSNVIVPSGKSCEIVDSTINGDVTVEKDATVYVSYSPIINGNFKAHEAKSIHLRELILRGNLIMINNEAVRIADGTGIYGESIIKGNEFFGSSEASYYGNSVIVQNEVVYIADIILHQNISVINNDSVNGEVVFGEPVFVKGNSVCAQNGELNDVSFVTLGKNNGCPV